MYCIKDLKDIRKIETRLVDQEKTRVEKKYHETVYIGYCGYNGCQKKGEIKGFRCVSNLCNEA